MAPMPLNHALQQLVIPAAQTNGNRLLRSYPVPEISGLWQRFIAGMPRTGVRRSVDALGTEWIDNQRQRTFVANVQMISNDRQSTGLPRGYRTPTSTHVRGYRPYRPTIAPIAELTQDQA